MKTLDAEHSSLTSLYVILSFFEANLFFIRKEARKDAKKPRNRGGELVADFQS